MDSPKAFANIYKLVNYKIIFFIFVCNPVSIFPDDEIFQVIQRFGKIERFALEYSTLRFMNVPKREIEGLFQSMGNMDIWNGDSCFINKLPGEFKRYG